MLRCRNAESKDGAHNQQYINKMSIYCRFGTICPNDRTTAAGGRADAQKIMNELRSLQAASLPVPAGTSIAIPTINGDWRRGKLFRAGGTRGPMEVRYEKKQRHRRDGSFRRAARDGVDLPADGSGRRARTGRFGLRHPAIDPGDLGRRSGFCPPLRMRGSRRQGVPQMRRIPPNGGRGTARAEDRQGAFRRDPAPC